ncbi:MAG: sodium-dependent bicarbonate transport family permease [Vicingaceae bacterium]|nr:sodium-dependent bicarbonate transport family permease [Vicingaceae bacterium]
MPFKIFLMIFAFILGIIFNHFNKAKKNKNNDILYQITIAYLLFRIGFLGGGELITQQWQTIFFQSSVIIVASSFWTLLVLTLLKRWSSFEAVTQISIATHFGSVSVGTFIAAIAFLDAMHIAIDSTVVIWLTIMEFPAIIIGMWKLGVSARSLLAIIKRKWALTILPISIALGMLFSKALPSTLSFVFFNQLFMPILLYFLFEMGCKASNNLLSLKKNVGSVLFTGIAIPILGGIFGSSIGCLMGYSTGNIFIMAILMASASYVLAPLCMYEILKDIYKTKKEIAKEVVSTSMALSIGVTLPFNIAIGFELYYMIIRALQTWPILAFWGLGLPLLLGVLSMEYGKK